MVEKKNLSTLVEAYARFARESVEKHGAGSVEHGEGSSAADHSVPALVFVGSGELEGVLREQARLLGLRVVDCTAAGSQSSGVSRQEGSTANCKPNTENSVEKDRGAVFFYGFRQIEENAVFYALAEAFVLPSLYEEWGLVVNEAMAAGLPVIVSRTAGCAEDLVPSSGNMERGAWSMEQEADVRAARPYLEQRSNGFAFDPASSDALSEALRRIADQKTKRLRDEETDGVTEMGQRSREIVAKFSCDNFARQAMRAAKAATP
jgi:glycosyltransferase involved in cell wall biosynthesis